MHARTHIAPCPPRTCGAVQAGSGRCGPGPAAARLGGLPGLRCGARGTARQVQLTDCVALACTHRTSRRGAVRGCTGGVGQEQAVWAWARRCAPEGRPGAPGDASCRRLAQLTARVPRTHLLPQACYNSGPTRRVRASGARAQGPSQALRAWGRSGAPASGRSRRLTATNRACPPAHPQHPSSQACYNSGPARRVCVGSARRGPEPGAAHLGGARAHLGAARAAA